jgi:hypothetical protein
MSGPTNREAVVCPTCPAVLLAHGPRDIGDAAMKLTVRGYGAGSRARLPRIALYVDFAATEGGEPFLELEPLDVGGETAAAKQAERLAPENTGEGIAEERAAFRRRLCGNVAVCGGAKGGICPAVGPDAQRAALLATAPGVPAAPPPEPDGNL